MVITRTALERQIRSSPDWIRSQPQELDLALLPGVKTRPAGLNAGMRVLAITRQTIELPDAVETVPKETYTVSHSRTQAAQGLALILRPHF